MYNPDNDVERILREDSRDKKKAGSGAYHNSGRRGGGTKGVSKLMMPSDFMSKKEKREYTKKGEIKMYNIYEDIKEIPSFEELKRMDREEAKEKMERIAKYHTRRVLTEKWKINDSSLRSFERTLGVKRRGKGVPSIDFESECKKEMIARLNAQDELRQANEMIFKMQESLDHIGLTKDKIAEDLANENDNLRCEMIEARGSVEVLQKRIKELEQKKIRKGLAISMKGSYSGGELMKALVGIATTMDNVEGRFYIDLEINEAEWSRGENRNGSKQV